MDSLAGLPQADRHDELVKRADEKIANAREQITRADEQIARVHEELSRLESVARSHPADTGAPAPTFRPVVPDRRSSRGRPVMRVLVSLLLAAFICVAAFAWRSPYGDAARSMLARSAPEVAQATLPSQTVTALSAQPASSTIQTAAGEQPSQQEPSAQPTQPSEAKNAEISPELVQTLETMARDLANLQQAVQQLRTSQDQVASDSVKAVEQLKDNQEQMARVLARLVEQSMQARTPAAAPRPATPATRTPVATATRPPAATAARTPPATATRTPVATAARPPVATAARPQAPTQPTQQR
jgi:chemotaxis protein histidine kinase CheA